MEWTGPNDKSGKFYLSLIVQNSSLASADTIGTNSLRPDQA